MGLWFMPLLLLTIPTRGERVSSATPPLLSLAARSISIDFTPSSITGISSLFRDSLLWTIRSLIAYPSIHKLLLYEPRRVNARDILRRSYCKSESRYVSKVGKCCVGARCWKYQAGGSLSLRAKTFVTVHEAGKHREKTAVKNGRSSDRVLG